MSTLAPLWTRRSALRQTSQIVPLSVEPLPRRVRALGNHMALRPILADLCYFALRLSGWLAVTALATLGLWALFFMALGAFTPEGFFAHLANLATRFGEADIGRQTVFVRQLTIVSLVLFLTLSAARYRSFLAVFSAVPDLRKD